MCAHYILENMVYSLNVSEEDVTSVYPVSESICKYNTVIEQHSSLSKLAIKIKF